MHPFALPAAWIELEAALGRAEPLEVFHGRVRRAGEALGRGHERGAMLVTCSDEFQGETRSSFERDVSRPLTAGSIVGSRRTFAVANLGGRVEPGALRLADDHFTNADGARKLLTVEIVAHCGIVRRRASTTWGRVERLGRESECCGALALLVADHPAAAAVRHPWFDQLSAFFGAERLAELRGDHSERHMLSAAIVHGVLQAESALTDLLREPPPSPTRVMIVAAVALNQTVPDQAIPVALHVVESNGEELALVRGVALRASPRALRFGERSGVMFADSDAEISSSSAARESAQTAEVVRAALREIDEDTSPEQHESREHAQLELARLRRHIEHLQAAQGEWRAHARPLLRAFVQKLSIDAPEVGLAVLALALGDTDELAGRIAALLERGSDADTARAALKASEARLQQLGFLEARRALELAAAELSLAFGPSV